MSDSTNDTNETTNEQTNVRKKSFVDSALKNVTNQTKRNNMLIIILSVIVVIATIAGVIVSINRKETDTTPDTGISLESNITIEENGNKLEEDKYPAVMELIQNYHTALKNGDTELLKSIYNTEEDINSEVLSATTTVITDYMNSKYYTKRGMNSGEFVAFVYDDLKLADIKTAAPNLSVFYIKEKEDGSLYIYRGEYNALTGSYAYDEATQNYINGLYEDADVTALISAVNQKMEKACAEDADLMSFMQKVRSRTNVTVQPTQSSETESTETTETAAVEE